MSGALVRAAWPPLAVFAAHVVASRALNAYERWPHLDVAMHFAGGAAIACFFGRAVEALARRREWLRLDRRVLALLVFALTVTAAVLWEFAEFLSDRYAGTAAQRGLEDTLGDLLLGLVGGLAYVAWRALRS
ncbi:MAG TPA: hypothetical protein VMT18_08750 [Planctomycetota bacterium]|nr:hypothetical protein [Planctomycetota bacterium]